MKESILCPQCGLPLSEEIVGAYSDMILVLICDNGHTTEIAIADNRFILTGNEWSLLF